MLPGCPYWKYEAVLTSTSSNVANAKDVPSEENHNAEPEPRTSSERDTILFKDAL
jgi:hypothetical protein